MTHAVCVEDLYKDYRGAPALRGVSIGVKPGEIYGLLGRNGAGKTTLVKILLDIVRASSGKAAILGLPSVQSLARRAVGYLPEDHRFPEYRTGEGLLHYYATLSGIGATRRNAQVPELLKLTGLSDAGKRKIRTYSKGMKQRLGLAQALVHDPRVIFLDEPTDGVDPVGRAQIRDLLMKLKNQGITIFLNSHLLSEVERLCDRVGIMEKGKLVREGTVEALTRGACLFTVATLPAPDEATRLLLQPFAISVREVNGAWEMELSGDEKIDAVIDLLRARQISVRSLASKRLTLEEVFLEAVDNKSKSGGAA